MRIYFLTVYDVKYTPILLDTTLWMKRSRLLSVQLLYHRDLHADVISVGLARPSSATVLAWRGVVTHESYPVLA